MAQTAANLVDLVIPKVPVRLMKKLTRKGILVEEEGQMSGQAEEHCCDFRAGVIQKILTHLGLESRVPPSGSPVAGAGETGDDWVWQPVTKSKPSEG